MINKEQLLERIASFHGFERLFSIVHHDEVWGYYYQLEAYRARQSDVSCTDFVLSALMKFGEGCWAEDKEELTQFVLRLTPRRIDEVEKEINENTKGRLSYLFKEIDNLKEAFELLNEWNNKAYLMITDDDYIIVCASTPE